MHVEILGCSGSISGDLCTMCLLLDQDILIDTGSGAGDLNLAQMVAVNTLLLTHSHLDHCGFLPLLADAAGNFRDTPLTVYALPQTIASIKRNILNSEIWPDYTVLPTPQQAGHEDDTMQEVLQAAEEFKPQILRRGMVFEF